mmetsp:Transcript_77512/g.240944  ORF Transcript_77512/g.240944 Transcript_77512/m.240944 type:complete len:204 (-) Transcript_77512:98-709(-)
MPTSRAFFLRTGGSSGISTSSRPLSSGWPWDSAALARKETTVPSTSFPGLSSLIFFKACCSSSALVSVPNVRYVVNQERSGTPMYQNIFIISMMLSSPLSSLSMMRNSFSQFAMQRPSGSRGLTFSLRYFMRFSLALNCGYLASVPLTSWVNCCKVYFSRAPSTVTSWPHILSNMVFTSDPLRRPEPSLSKSLNTCATSWVGR